MESQDGTGVTAVLGVVIGIGVIALGAVSVRARMRKDTGSGAAQGGTPRATHYGALGEERPVVVGPTGVPVLAQATEESERPT